MGSTAARSRIVPSAISPLFTGVQRRRKILDGVFFVRVAPGDGREDAARTGVFFPVDGAFSSIFIVAFEWDRGGDRIATAPTAAAGSSVDLDPFSSSSTGEEKDECEGITGATSSSSCVVLRAQRIDDPGRSSVSSSPLAL